jgi:hypothetical protein
LSFIAHSFQLEFRSRVGLRGGLPREVVVVN